MVETDLSFLPPSLVLHGLDIFEAKHHNAWLFCILLSHSCGGHLALPDRRNQLQLVQMFACLGGCAFNYSS